MYVCMYVCMHVCTYVRTYVRMYVCMYICMNGCKKVVWPRKTGLICNKIQAGRKYSEADQVISRSMH